MGEYSLLWDALYYRGLDVILVYRLFSFISLNTYILLYFWEVVLTETSI